MHATTLVIIYNYVLFCFRWNIIFHHIILYNLQYSDLFIYLIRDPIWKAFFKLEIHYVQKPLGVSIFLTLRK